MKNRISMLLLFFFFFQAEDGIRVYKVTGVQTCALPILAGRYLEGRLPRRADAAGHAEEPLLRDRALEIGGRSGQVARAWRSEERRVGKGCSCVLSMEE